MQQGNNQTKTGRMAENIFTSDEILPNNFIAAAVSLDYHTGVPSHAGILVGYNGKVRLLHLDMEDGIEFDELQEDDWYIARNFLTIDPDETNAFVVHAQQIKTEAKPPEWSYWYNGSYFKNGVSCYDEQKPFYTTCVGFCLAVLTGFIEEPYLEYKQWLPDTSLQYFEFFCSKVLKQYPSLTKEEFAKDYRRIRPEEYFASSFIAPCPIEKYQTENVLKNIRPILSKMHKSRRNLESNTGKETSFSAN